MISKIKFKGDLLMKKRIVSIMLVVCLLSLVACQNGASDNIESTATETQTETQTKKKTSGSGINKKALFKDVAFKEDRMMYSDKATASDLTRKPQNYIDKDFALETHVIQLVEDGSSFLVKGGPECYSVILCSVYENNLSTGNNILVVVKLNTDLDRIIVNDNVTFYCKGTDKTYSYTTVLGSRATVPVVISEMYDIH
jgi:hypothetical protein